MPRPAWPRIKYVWSYAFMAALALFVLAMVAVTARPHPPAIEAAAWSPEWRCTHPVEGDPICVRDLPPAVKPGNPPAAGVVANSPARSAHEPGR